MLGALMGSSGAGKTTLLDVLAQRKTEGTINSSIIVDGRPLSVSFQRSTGYCEKLDVHEPSATTPRNEKPKYIDTVIDLLELHDLADTLIGKRVAIGVELVSKPSVSIFLDEPTSGLDDQSAYNTAILVTIHQPSARFFAQFDTLLLLSKGGKTV
ncbi:hypothetical protein ASPWEDRAFT_54445 [Aspergillus wentii DTO 134E9]|uniref:AAA+ ATPase domain-containing protein n=1 Tax=Aspergillus wentii DTO 134E9 TaxID=1073089 RepID=A0A1L9R8I3_ASPWE|nr:uncharacterized protein ASPWEDRAFT_54445 [Aspergillus wentii DTO 134E9]OJJ31193.1 hypothetical protein ASPWEDRAFT_54445 [Aspergillus wentii DTO 134E9]